MLAVFEFTARGAGLDGKNVANIEATVTNVFFSKNSLIWYCLESE